MLSIRKPILEKALNDESTQQLLLDDSFCSTIFNKPKSKCKSFYKKITQLQPGSFCNCPYGYCCYVPSNNNEAILTSIICEKSDIHKIKARNKITKKAKEKIIISQSSEIKSKFESYVAYLSLVSTCDNICHDLNNALNYFVELGDSAINKTDNELKQKYKSIIEKIQDIQEVATYKQFALDSEFDCQILLKRIKILEVFVDKVFEYSEKKLKEINYEIEDARYCFYAGISLIRTLLRRNLIVMTGTIESTGKHKDFSLHKMVMKISLLLRYKAANKSVSFPAFCGSPKKRIINNTDNVFTIIFTIIDNAIKYSNYNDNIYISFIENENELVLSVANSSKEISNDNLKHLHDKGYRGMNKSEKGRGLGLYLVRVVCENSNIGYEANYKNGMFIYRLHFKDLYS